MTALQLVSFGFLHGTPPTGDTVEDIRDWFRDPHIDPQLRQLTARDSRVVHKVLSTDGVYAYLNALYDLVAVRLRQGVRTVNVAIGCAGGRHRAPVVVDMLAMRAEAAGYHVEVVHRDIDLPVIEREVTL